MDMSPEQAKELQERVKNMSPEELREFQKQQCIFCHIISGKAQAKKVYEDERCIAILDIKPANPGHMLLMPKEHYSIMPLMPDDEISHLFQVSKHLAKACLVAFRKEGEEKDLGATIFAANGAVAGQRAQHFMIHVIPRKENDGVEGLDVIEKTISKQDLKEIRERLMPRVRELLGYGKAEEEPEKKKAEPKREEKAEKKEKPKTGSAARKPRKEEVVDAEFKELLGGEEEAEEGEKPKEEENEEKAGKGIDLDDISRVLFK